MVQRCYHTGMNYIEQLQIAGLPKDQATLYAVLVQHGPQTATKAARLAGISRTLSYKVFDELKEKGLVTRDDPEGAVSVFTPAHPTMLKELADARAREANAALTAIDSVVGTMVADYNLVVGKPGVRFFEGVEGISEVLDDSLQAKEVIYSYADLEAIEKYVPEVNKLYVREREKRCIKKKGIVLDTLFAREFLKDYKPGITEARVIPASSAPFQTVMQIYDNTVSYITLTDAHCIGVLIEDPHIADMHRYLFEHMWSIASEPLTTA